MLLPSLDWTRITLTVPAESHCCKIDEGCGAYLGSASALAQGPGWTGTPLELLWLRITIMESQHGLGWKKPLKVIQTNPPAMGKDTGSGCSESCPTWPACLQGWNFHSSSGQLAPLSCHHHQKKPFLISDLNLPSSSSKPLALVLLLQALVRSLFLTSVVE